jgi:hypothetical protein
MKYMAMEGAGDGTILRNMGDPAFDRLVRNDAQVYAATEKAARLYGKLDDFYKRYKK